MAQPPTRGFGHEPDDGPGEPGRGSTFEPRDLVREVAAGVALLLMLLVLIVFGWGLATLDVF
jgi:hypothetical protein